MTIKAEELPREIFIRRSHADGKHFSAVRKESKLRFTSYLDYQEYRRADLDVELIEELAEALRVLGKQVAKLPQREFSKNPELAPSLIKSDSALTQYNAFKSGGSV